jgi:peptidoglycan/xylan/chitin deacetylase (PgdA/CDA1 family)
VQKWEETLLKLIENPVPWPNGARVAVCLSFDIDTDSMLHLDHPDRADQLIATQSWLRYDRIAVPRLVSIFKHFGIRQTFFFPAWCMEQYPAVVDCLLKAGHEIAHHGYLHENPNERPPDDERYWLERCLEVFKKMTGVQPRGSRAPFYNFSKSSLDLLIEHGFTYDASLMGDDVPYLLRGGKGDLLELPSHWAMDDWPQYAHLAEFNYLMTIRAPSEAAQVFMAEFEAMWRHRGMLIGVWHPFVSGRLARAEGIVSMIEKMIERGEVWFAAMEDIAQHVSTCIAAKTFTPKIEVTPAYDGPIPRLGRPKTT